MTENTTPPHRERVELLMDSTAIDRALTRISHQILEHTSLDSLGIVGMQTRGVPLAQRLAKKISVLGGHPITTGILDPTFYRDDYRTPFRQPKVKVTDIPFDINGMDIILVDDVLYTGRTVRAALSALMDFGRSKTIQLAVLIDRGHRELPIRADYVGMKTTTKKDQEISLNVTEIDGEDSLWLMKIPEGS